jgi:hypothetical protein
MKIKIPVLKEYKLYKIISKMLINFPNILFITI